MNSHPLTEASKSKMGKKALCSWKDQKNDQQDLVEKRDQSIYPLSANRAVFIGEDEIVKSESEIRQLVET